MERGGGATVATLYAPTTLDAGALVSLDEGAAHHARVRRLDAGDAVGLTDGEGRVARGEILRVAKSGVDVSVAEVRRVAPPPRLVLHVPVADRERMLWLAEKATELGVTGWHPVMFRRSRSVSPRGEGEAFQQKARARMISALEQSGGAWLPLMFAESSLAEAASTSAAHRFLLDERGVPLLGAAAGGTDDAAVMVGPEGGLEPDERALLVARGWQPVSVAVHTLRFETAGVAAAAVLRAVAVRALQRTEE